MKASISLFLFITINKLTRQYMNLTGKQIIGFGMSREGTHTFRGINPVNGEALSPEYAEATTDEINRAGEFAHQAFQVYRKTSPEQRAKFLDQIATEIEKLGDALIQRAMAETGLPEGRFKGERGRTCGQLRMFARLIREGSWVDARIDTADPDRKPFPKADIRYVNIAIGPVGIFGASNFPLAFSVAGGDTASALAAGCTVVVKGHPAHPGTSELVGHAIIEAAKATSMPEGVFSMLHGTSHEVGMGIVTHLRIKAIGFTGSYRGGKAIFDAANQRKEPIPVYAEMGSTNPVFILPEALKTRGEEIAKGLSGSVTLGVGQFCTNPGLVIGMGGEELDQFTQQTGGFLKDIDPGPMLTGGIQKAYYKGVEKLEAAIDTVAVGHSGATKTAAHSRLFQTSGDILLKNPSLAEEVFGPSSIIVSADQKSQLMEIAEQLDGHLTATLHGTDDELEEYADLIAILEQKVGRLLINGFPTGVEVCHSMVHGGPFPATTNSRSTSVGTAAIFRFARPVCYQNFPQSLLPDVLKDGNPLGIWRMVDGERTKEAI